MVSVTCHGPEQAKVTAIVGQGSCALQEPSGLASQSPPGTAIHSSSTFLQPSGVTHGTLALLPPNELMNGQDIYQALAMYPLPVDAKNHEMTSVSRGPRVQEGAVPQQVMLAYGTGTMAVVMGKFIIHATNSSLSLDPIEKWTWESGSVSFSVDEAGWGKNQLLHLPLKT